MFSLARALSSPASAEDGSSLFDRFTGPTARSDSSRACPSAVRLSAFSDRSRSWLDREAPEVSRFSCMLFSQRARVLRLRRANGSLASSRGPVVLPSLDGDEVGALIPILFEAR